MKKCNKCCLEKDVSCFYKRTDTKSVSYSHICKECSRENEKQKPITEEDRKRGREAVRRWRERHPEKKYLTTYQKRKERKVCEICGFVPKHICQLDVDHIDGNHKNNDPKNLQVLCANCHRLKSYQERRRHGI